MEQIKAYRDKFVAHLDSKRKMKFPHLDPALAALFYYVEFLGNHEPLMEMLSEADEDVRGTFSRSETEAAAFCRSLAHKE